MSSLGNFFEDFCCVNDEVCLKVEVVNSSQEGKSHFIPLWNNLTDLDVNGTILITNNGVENSEQQGITVDLVLNNKEQKFHISPGESKAFTADRLKSVAILGEFGTGVTTVDVTFSLNYKL